MATFQIDMLKSIAPLESTRTSTTTPAPAKTHTPTDPGEVLENWSSLIGIVTAIIGNVLIALALNVQRYAHTRLHKERIRSRRRARAAIKRASHTDEGGFYGTIPAESDRRNPANGSADSRSAEDVSAFNESNPSYESFHSGSATDPDLLLEEGESKANSTYLKSPYWWLGQILITLGEMGNFLAYGFAPASIVSPLGVVALISNCIIAPVMFHERFRARDFWGVLIAVAGVVTVVFSANQEETKLEPHDVWESITTMGFEIYLGVTILLIIVLMWASGKYGKRTILIDLGLVGLFGGYTALATKGVSSMLSSTLWRAFTTPVTYALVFILLVTAVMQIRYVNKALQRFDSTQVIPIQFVLFTLSVILGSAILYRDFEKTTPKQAVCFVGGCLLTFFGVFLITSGRQNKDEDDEEDLLSDVEGIEETIGLIRHEETSGAPVTPANETPQAKSRRSSRLSKVSFAETVKAETSRKKPEASRTRNHASDSAPQLIGIEPHSPLPETSWRDSWQSSASPPRGLRTPFAEFAGAESALASTPSTSAVTTPLRDPAVIPVYPSDRPVTPRNSSGISRTNSGHRSKTFISPSPLSSTVTTVVKDAFLRGSEGAFGRRSSLRRIRSSIRASLFFNSDDDDRGDNPAGYVPLPRSDVHLQESSDAPAGTAEYVAKDATRGRSRSVGDAIGVFFWPKRNKTTSDVSPGIETGGPSEHEHNDESALSPTRSQIPRL